MSAEQRRRGRAPAASPRARWFAVLLALALITVALIAARELTVHYLRPEGWQPWLGRAVGVFRAPDPRWVGAAGAAAVALGLAFLLAAVTPRRRAHRALAGTRSAVWVRRVDVARYTTATAKRFPGVVSASSLAKNDSVTVTAEMLNPDDAARERLRQEITDAVRPVFGEAFRVRIVLRDTVEDDAMLPPAGGAA
ncbi:DUF6286 domain-containing protein [Corynebacterium guangdongense]|uniref:DUF6286 domain-containing protein n=1 Tax=Corynebacterium guangdongense TaxID=1783348 RepID=A0ABU1ZVV8_9CORY|nr:DUF6286 domain-containing protein [Corynebacterium guangdongense]MDR7328498.1 hypothetical protein [Corynebacterium guangdongense]WJZ17075.1 hypothetical protein CGUA_02395 [Corynebacterium guangdongense]